METSVYHPDLEVRSLFARSWERFKANLWPTVAVFIVYSLLSSAGNFWGEDGGLGELIMFIISGPITAGAYMYALYVVRGAQPDYGVLFSGFQRFGRAFGVFALYWLMVVVGLVLLVVPGIYVAIALMPAMYLVLDDDLGVIESLQKAWAMTEGYRGSIFIVLLAILGLNLLGLTVFFVGVVFTGALSLLVGAQLYDELDRAYETRYVESRV